SIPTVDPVPWSKTKHLVTVGETDTTLAIMLITSCKIPIGNDYFELGQFCSKKFDEMIEPILTEYCPDPTTTEIHHREKRQLAQAAACILSGICSLTYSTYIGNRISSDVEAVRRELYQNNAVNNMQITSVFENYRAIRH